MGVCESGREKEKNDIGGSRGRGGGRERERE